MKLKHLIISLLLIVILWVFTFCGPSADLLVNDSDNVIQIREKARSLLEEEYYSESINAFELLLKKYPNDFENCAWAQYTIGFIHYIKGNYDLARSEFQKVLLYEKKVQEPREVSAQIKLANKLIKKIDRGETYKNSTYYDEDEETLLDDSNEEW